MTQKQLLIIALLEHLYQLDICENMAMSLRKVAKDKEASGKVFVPTAMEAWRYEQRVKRHRKDADFLTLLISLPLFYDAVDILKHGKSMRFYEDVKP